MRFLAQPSSCARTLCDTVQVLCYGEGHDEPGFKTKAEPGAGRKRERDPEKEAADQEALAGTDYAVWAPFSPLAKGLSAVHAESLHPFHNGVLDRVCGVDPNMQPCFAAIA